MLPRPRIRPLPLRLARRSPLLAPPLRHNTTTTASSSAPTTQEPPAPSTSTSTTHPIVRTVRNKGLGAPPAAKPALDSPHVTFTTSEPYTVTRTRTLSLPVYHERKAPGGNQKLTVVRKVQGALGTLKEQLEGALEPSPQWVKCNWLTGHVVVKGFYKEQVDKFLIAKGF